MKLLTNGKIFTMNDLMPWAEAIAFEDDKITYVGNAIDAPTVAEVYDLRGKMVIPGIIDGHTHPGMVSQSSWHIRLPWTEKSDEILDFVREYAKEHPKEEAPFLYFEYYPTCMFGTNGPTKELLDTAVSDRPCLCQDFGEHLHWVNSNMLEMMGVNKYTPDPVPGLEMFVRDEDGNPTGWVKEFAWVRFLKILCENIGWKPPMTMTPELMTNFFEFQKKHGITALGDGMLEGEEQAKSTFELDKAGKLKIYYDGVVRFWSYEDLPEKIADLRRFQILYSGKHIKYNTMKLFLDGTNESGNSALLNVHVNDPKGVNCGKIKMETEELTNCFLLCNRERLDLHIHMVGDRAFRVACDAVEAAQQEVKAQNVEWVCQPVFAHCEIIDPVDMLRPAKLGITINWSCHWSGGYFGEEAMNFISEEKWQRMYQFNPIIESGALVAFSSDATTFYELHRANPFFSMQVAHTRVDPEFPLNSNKYPGSMRPPASARLSRETLLKGYTIGSAKQMRWDDKMGSIEVGKLANLNVISDNFFEVPADQIANIKFEAVIFDGKLVFGRI